MPFKGESNNEEEQEQEHIAGSSNNGDAEEPGRTEADTLPLELDPLTSRSLLALRNLVRYGRRRTRRDGAQHGWHEWPNTRRAAVMVALFAGRSGELNVLLSTRALELRINVS
jgi:hypothetical protein